jgi:hypothetical protein
LQVNRLRSAAAPIVLRLEGDLRAFRELLKARPFDCRYMDEDVLAAALRRDEAETAVVVEELQGAVLARPALTWLVALEAAATAAAAEAAIAAATATAVATTATLAITAVTAAATAAAIAAATTATAIATTATAAASTIAATAAFAVTRKTATVAKAATGRIATRLLSAEIPLSAEFTLPAAPGCFIAAPILATTFEVVVVPAVLAHHFKFL